MTSTQIHRLYLILEELIIRVAEDFCLNIDVGLNDGTGMIVRLTHLDDERVSYIVEWKHNGRKMRQPQCVTFIDIKSWDVDTSQGLLYGWLNYIQKNTLENN